MRCMLPSLAEENRVWKGFLSLESCLFSEMKCCNCSTEGCAWLLTSFNFLRLGYWMGGSSQSKSESLLSNLYRLSLKDSDLSY